MTNTENDTKDSIEKDIEGVIEKFYRNYAGETYIGSITGDTPIEQQQRIAEALWKKYMKQAKQDINAIIEREKIKELEGFDLRESYINRLAKVTGAAMDWEALGFLQKTPNSYHFTRSGKPDKRYANYPEVLAYWEAELEERTKLIKRISNEPI